MSRTQKGSKPLGWDYWGKRKGSWCVDRKTSHKMERMQHKEEDRDLVEDALTEMYSLNECETQELPEDLVLAIDVSIEW